MSKFVKFLGTAHINALNLALYEGGGVRVENVASGGKKALGVKKFGSVEAAEDWFHDLAPQHDNMTRLTRGISQIAPSITFP